MATLDLKLSGLARYRQEMGTLQTTTEEKFAEMEAKIQQVSERILEVDESSIGDGKYLIERLIRIEKSFDENLTTKISSLATNNTKIWVDFKKETDNKSTKLKEDVYEKLQGVEDNIQSQAIELKSLGTYQESRDQFGNKIWRIHNSIESHSRARARQK